VKFNRYQDPDAFGPDRTCVGCGRTVTASDMVREHCPQCQEDGTLDATRPRCAEGCGGVVDRKGNVCIGCVVSA
jgi:hypothetical protein